MATEARNAILVVGSDDPANPPQVRNTVLVVGSDAPANPPEIRNAILVVGYDDPAFLPAAAVTNRWIGSRTRRRIGRWL